MNHFGYTLRVFKPPKGKPMPILDSLISPIISIIDKVIPDKAARDRAMMKSVCMPTLAANHVRNAVILALLKSA